MATEAISTGAIEGYLTDAQGQLMHTGQAVVFLCDATTGMPLSREKRSPIDFAADLIEPAGGYWHAVTSDGGGFEFSDVPAGTYRLVAQVWSGVAGMPRTLPRSLRGDSGVEPSSVIILLGVAESVEVKAGETALAYPRRWGDGVLNIVTDPEEPHNFLVISRCEPLGDPALGPLGWGHDFVAGIIGVTRMEDSRLTLVGLPNKAEIHVGLWNYDNSVGTGGGSFAVGNAEQVRLPIYGGWSNAKYEPPTQLARLTDHLEQSGLDVNNMIGLERPASLTREYLLHVWRHAADVSRVDGFGDAKVIDLLAADSYRRLRKHHRQQRERGVPRPRNSP
jgi:hypothetical protein